MIKIHWFRHNHENRNDWLRFGLMELATAKEIKYFEWNLNKMTEYGFSREILNEVDLRHKSFILVDNGNKKTKCLVDSEDSFALFSHLIECVDSYFCAGYNTDLFKHKKLPKFYSWQGDEDVSWYKTLLNEKIKLYGDHFYKVKKFIPIAPNLHKEIALCYPQRLFYNLKYRLRKLLNLSNNYDVDYKIYKSRFTDLLNLRNQKLLTDITLSDTSWGWPLHRIKLHQSLNRFSSEGYIVNSILKYSESSKCDNSISLHLNENDFPMSIGIIDNYEKMLASSKLGVFACGFHWGWRNILSLALFIGIPVITDRLLTEAYFDLNTFKIWETEDEDWLLVKELLNNIGREGWETIKVENQTSYDKYLAPEVVAQYFVNAHSI